MLSKPKKNIGQKKIPLPKIAMNQKIKVTPLESQTLGTSQNLRKKDAPQVVHEPSFKVNNRYLDKKCTEVGFFLGDIRKKYGST